MTNRSLLSIVFMLLAVVSLGAKPADNLVSLHGEMKPFNKITLDLQGPAADETSEKINPFTDYRFTVSFQREGDNNRFEIPGYFAADGNASETSASKGSVWRAHFSASQPGKWNWKISFVEGKQIAIQLDEAGKEVKPFHGLNGSFVVAGFDSNTSNILKRGRLVYNGGRYLNYSGTGEYFLKAGPDAPETLLAYKDIDGTVANNPKKCPLKKWQPHVRDWKEGDPTWKDGKGKGLIGAINYIQSKGCNHISMLTYNAGGDGDNVWPFIKRNEKFRYDCSKLDQWGVIFDYANSVGVTLHFKLQETENDDDRRGHKKTNAKKVPTSLDGGLLGPERKLYLRELVARYGHLLAMEWNVGEENTQSTKEQLEMVQYIQKLDAHNHLIVLHTYPDQQDKVYTPLLGNENAITGLSLQNSWDQAHQRTLKWVLESQKTKRHWVVSNDEQGPADQGVPADPGFEGKDGKGWNKNKTKSYNLHDIRKATLWGTLMAGGTGVSYYFGYKLPQNDLRCENWRSREKSWDYCNYALRFFYKYSVPLPKMKPADELVENSKHTNEKYCLAQHANFYVVYLSKGGSTLLDLKDAEGEYSVDWYNPRTGGELQKGSFDEVFGGSKVNLGLPPEDTDNDWVILVQRKID